MIYVFNQIFVLFCFQAYLNLDKLDSVNFTDKFAFRQSPELVNKKNYLK